MLSIDTSLKSPSLTYLLHSEKYFSLKSVLTFPYHYDEN